MTTQGDGRYDTDLGDVQAVILVDKNGVQVTGDKTIAHATVTMADDDTQYTLAIPENASNIAIFLGSSNAWRWSPTTGVVATPGAGVPVAADEKVTGSGPFSSQTLYVAHTAGTSQTLHLIYEVGS